MLAPAAFKKIHPLGKAPLLTIQAEGASEPIVLAESGPIAEYLIDHFGPSLAPAQWQEGKENQVQGETEEWLRYRYFMHYTEGTLMPYLVTALLLQSKSSRFHVLLDFRKMERTGHERNDIMQL